MRVSPMHDVGRASMLRTQENTRDDGDLQEGDGDEGGREEEVTHDDLLRKKPSCVRSVPPGDRIDALGLREG